MVIQAWRYTLLFLPFLYGALLGFCNGKTIQIVTNTTNAAGDVMILREGLRAIRSDTVLELHPGTHTLDRLVLVSSYTNVTIQGVQSAESTVISCVAGFGLSFFNITNFEIRNVTVTNCGVHRGKWDAINNTIYQEFDVIIGIPNFLRVAIVIAACTDLTLDNFAVRNTSGIGFLGANLMGNTEIRNSQFDLNRSPRCPTVITSLTDPLFPQWIGGGAYILYQDFKSGTINLQNNLTITESLFSRNQDCSRNFYIESLLESSRGLANVGYHIGAGGGLSITMAQLQYSVDVRVTRSFFADNLARSGGGVHVGLFSGALVGNLLLDECNFIENGIKDVTSSGGGLQIYTDLARPSEIRMERTIDDVEGELKIRIQNCAFRNNSANSGGGAAITAQYSEQHVFDRSVEAVFDCCTFDGNSASGGILVVYERKNSGSDVGLQTYICSCVFANSSSVSVGDSFASYGTVNTENINLTLCGNVAFYGNKLSGIAAHSTLVNVLGYVLFEENEALNGAGIQLLRGSLLILRRNSSIVFQENEAMFGGAIYVDFMVDPVANVYNEDCFLYFEEPQFVTCVQEDICTPENLNISIVFDSNEANSGSMVYGSALETCSWVTKMRSEPNYDLSKSVYENIHQFNHTFHFDVAPSTSMEVSTPTVQLSIAQANISVMPGQSFTLNVLALDAFGHQIQEVITSARGGNGGRNKNIASIIAESNYLELGPRGQQSAPITTYGLENQSTTVRLVTVDLRVNKDFVIFLNSCYIGFTYNSPSCVCDDRLTARQVSCNNTSTYFSVSDGYWFGPIDDEATSNDDLTVAKCILNYCSDSGNEVMLNDTGTQCSEGFYRTGLLCGKCRPGYSIQLGSYRCAKCTNWSLMLLLFFAAAGIVVVYLTGILRISVAEGFFCACLFFSNIMALYVVFLDSRTPFREVNFLSAFFTLNFGIESCFYDGMDSQVLMTLQLLFVVYLLFLMICQILLVKYNNSKLILILTKQYSPSKVISTFIILSYVSLLQASVGILSFSIVQPLSGPARLVWLVDPTVPYFGAFHTLLALVAFLLFFLYIMPLPILLTFFSSALYRWRYFRKLKPLYDAMFAPYKARCRSWLGIQLFVRLILFSFAYFVPTPHKLLCLSACLVFYLYILSVIQPYNSKWVNVMESSLISIILLLATIKLYFGNVVSVSKYVALPIMTLIVFIAYGIILVSFFVYFQKQFAPKLGKLLQRKFRNKAEAKATRSNDLRKTATAPQIRLVDTGGQEIALGTVSKSNKEEMHVMHSHLNSQSAELQVSFTEYREPLLDEGNLDVSHSYAITVSSRSSSATDLRAVANGASSTSGANSGGR